MISFQLGQTILNDAWHIQKQNKTTAWMNELRCLLLEQIEGCKVNDINDISSIEQIEKVVYKLKNNGASDHNEVMGEHLENVKNTVVRIIL